MQMNVNLDLHELQMAFTLAVKASENERYGMWERDAFRTICRHIWRACRHQEEKK